ncbi:hypothetical protein ACHAXR_006572 [Thalassiosira sp. AJA248-18]
MASLRFTHPSWALSVLRTCQRSQCSVSCGATRVVAQNSSLRGVHLSRPSVVGDDDGRHLCWTAANRRLFHASCCSQNKDKGVSNNDQTVSISQLPDEDNIEDQSQLGGSFTDIPGATNTKAKKLAIIYTCKVCDTRSAKQFTEQAYKHGVVLVRCPGCQNLHLIADRLGMFEDRGEDGQGWDVEKVLANAGENVKAVTGDNVLELTMDDIMGKKS